MIKKLLRTVLWSIVVLAVPIACYTWWYGWTNLPSDFVKGMVLLPLVIITLGTIGMECSIIWFGILGKEDARG